MLIYLVEDEKNLNTLLCSYIQRESYTVMGFYSAEEAEFHIDNAVDLWIIDIMLPGKDGFELFNFIKTKTPHIPILFISARNTDIDRLLGLEIGGDDYISKPFMPRELIIKINRILNTHKSKKLNYLEYEINLTNHHVLHNKTYIHLSQKEFELFIYFIENEGIALSREQILNAIWQSNWEKTHRAVDDTVRRLRKKLPSLHLETIYGYGYLLEYANEKT